MTKRTTPTKRAALGRVRQAAMDLAYAQPGQRGHNVDKFRAANTAVADARYIAAIAGATPGEIEDAAEWNGAQL